VPIPKKTRQYIYPESGFEARYERVPIFYDGKNAYSFGSNLRDGLVTGDFSLSASEPPYGI
jgi:hypothetical protein